MEITHCFMLLFFTFFNRVTSVIKNKTPQTNNTLELHIPRLFLRNISQRPLPSPFHNDSRERHSVKSIEPPIFTLVAIARRHHHTIFQLLMSRHPLAPKTVHYRHFCSFLKQFLFTCWPHLWCANT